MKLSDDYFHIMQVPQSYYVDGAALSENYIKLQSQFHPDRFAAKSVQEQRLAVQMASAVNQAYETLRSPLLRAAYLLKLRGLDSSGENTTVSDMTFLMSQMQLREQLGAVTTAAEPFVELDLVAIEVTKQLNNLQEQFGTQYGQDAFDEAAQTLVKMQFFYKLQLEVDALEESLEDA